MSTIYCGWTHKDFLSRKELLAFGVKGSMRRNKNGNIEQCEATYDVMIRLIEAGLSNSGSFTAINADTKEHLPESRQTFWHWQK